MYYKKKYEDLVIAVKALQEANPSDEGIKNWVADNVPELRQNEDEKIRKALIENFKCFGGDYLETSKWGKDDDLLVTDILAWLEKQGEQKSNWSEEDEIGFGDALWCCKQATSIAKDENDMGNIWYAERWLNTIKDRIQPQPKQEWSEDDISNIDHLLNALCGVTELKQLQIDKLIIWLKALKDRVKPQWKPSKGQLNALNALNLHGDISYVGQQKQLVELYEQLKKL